MSCSAFFNPDLFPAHKSTLPVARLHQNVETRISRGVWMYPSTCRVGLAPPPRCKGVAALDQEEAAKLESALVHFSGETRLARPVAALGTWRASRGTARSEHPALFCSLELCARALGGASKKKDSEPRTLPAWIPFFSTSSSRRLFLWSPFFFASLFTISYFHSSRSLIASLLPRFSRRLPPI